MTMGRSVADDPAFHLAAGAAGILASESTPVPAAEGRQRGAPEGPRP
jgi:hypothetical protein